MDGIRGPGDFMLVCLVPLTLHKSNSSINTDKSRLDSVTALIQSNTLTLYLNMISFTVFLAVYLL